MKCVPRENDRIMTMKKTKNVARSLLIFPKATCNGPKVSPSIIGFRNRKPAIVLAMPVLISDMNRISSASNHSRFRV